MLSQATTFLLFVTCLIGMSHAFVPIHWQQHDHFVTQLRESTTADKDDIIAARIHVKGDVQGGYYRCCVVNEATKFRKLNGMMSNPDGSDGAEIYVEGKRNQVEGFLRWCKKADKKIGMSQVVQVVDVVEEEATGLYDSFYCKVKA